MFPAIGALLPFIIIALLQRSLSNNTRGSETKIWSGSACRTRSFSACLHAKTLQRASKPAGGLRQRLLRLVVVAAVVVSPSVKPFYVTSGSYARLFSVPGTELKVGREPQSDSVYAWRLLGAGVGVAKSSGEKLFIRTPPSS